MALAQAVPAIPKLLSQLVAKSPLLLPVPLGNGQMDAGCAFEGHGA